MTFKIILIFFKISPQIYTFNEISPTIDFFHRLIISFESLHKICPNISKLMKNKNSQTAKLTIFNKSINFHVKNIDCRSPPRMPASYHSSRIAEVARQTVNLVSGRGTRNTGQNVSFIVKYILHSSNNVIEASHCSFQ